jgi:hypothetical protein
VTAYWLPFALALGLVAGCSGSPEGPSDVSPPGVTDGLASGVYYVAANESGADNDRCDGRSPTLTGAGSCPFRDFSSARVQRVLAGTRGVRVEVRAGSYALPAGLIVEGAGNSDGERVVLVNYSGETAVLDGANASREAVRVQGRYVTVEGLTIQNSAGYNLEVRGAQQVLITGNRFLHNRASDSLKGDGGASDVVVRGNEFAQWDSQAIDLTGVSRWTIEGNRFGLPGAADANAIGVKFGSREVLIADNQFTRTRGIALGGTSAAHANAYEAFNVTARGNTFEGVPLFAVTLYSCFGCRLQNNSIRGADAGVRLASSASMGQSGCPGGCQPTRDLVVTNNRFRNLVGNAEGPPDVFWVVDSTETRGLSPSANTYCQSRAASAMFFYAANLLSFPAWLSMLPGDASSVVAGPNDPPCIGW